MNIKDINIECIKVYGESCYGLSGETKNVCNDLKGFILELFKLTEACEENKNEDEALELPEDFIDYFVGEVLKGTIGNEDGICYKNIELSQELSYDQLYDLLKGIQIDGNSYDNLEDQDYDDYLHINY